MAERDGGLGKHAAAIAAHSYRPSSSALERVNTTRWSETQQLTTDQFHLQPFFYFFQFWFLRHSLLFYSALDIPIYEMFRTKITPEKLKILLIPNTQAYGPYAHRHNPQNNEKYRQRNEVLSSDKSGTGGCLGSRAGGATGAN